MIPARIELPKLIDNPGARAIDIYTIKPLTTNVNSPKVTRMAGIDNITTIGFITEFTS